MRTTPNDSKLSDRGTRLGTCMVDGRPPVEARALPHGAVRCRASLRAVHVFASEIENHLVGWFGSGWLGTGCTRERSTARGWGLYEVSAGSPTAPVSRHCRVAAGEPPIASLEAVVGCAVLSASASAETADATTSYSKPPGLTTAALTPKRLHAVPDDPLDQLRIGQPRLAR